jgi:hypothetical protein
MNHARIIKLDSPLTVVSSNFEEAFGEYSNMSARRKARILKRNKDRQEVNAARAETRRERIKQRGQTQQARIEKRRAVQQARIAKRTEAQASRQRKRQLAMEARQKRKNDRAKLSAEREAAKEQEGANEEQGGGEESEVEEQGSGEEQGGGEGQYQYDEQESGGDEGSSEESGDEETPPYDAESGADGYYDSFASADGINYEDLGSTDDLIALMPDDFYTYESGAANPGGEIGIIKQKISPEIKSIAQKSEWNKEMVLQLNNKVAAINNTLEKGVSSDKAIQLGKTRANLMSKAELSKDRAIQFDGMMSDYVNFDGDTMDYSGDDAMSYAGGKRRKKSQVRMANPKGNSPSALKIKLEKRKRLAEIMAAKREAMKLRKKMILSKMKQSRMRTKVAKGLKPEFDTQKITIPAADLTTGASGETGLIAIDDANDFDAPQENTFTFSNASGTSAKKWGGILLGALVIGAAIWYGKKKKLF